MRSCGRASLGQSCAEIASGSQLLSENLLLWRRTPQQEPRLPSLHILWSSLEDGGQCVWPLYTPACAFYSHSHSGTVSSVGFCLRKLHIFYLCKDTHVAGVFTF